MAIEQPFYHPVPYDVALFHHSKIYFSSEEGRSLSLWGASKRLWFSSYRTDLFRQERPKSFPWLRQHHMNLSDKYNLNWKLNTFKISHDDIKGSFFTLRTIARYTTSVVFLTRGFGFLFCATLLCLFWMKWSRYKPFFGSNSKFRQF